MRDKEINIICENCGREYGMKVDEKDYRNWQNGELIQVAMPYLEPSERELLISGICEECFLEIMFGG